MLYGKLLDNQKLWEHEQKAVQCLKDGRFQEEWKEAGAKAKTELLEAVTEEILEKEAELKNRRKELEKSFWDFGNWRFRGWQSTSCLKN